MIDVKFIGRKAYPSRISIGVMKDNEIEALRFSLPEIGEAQASFLYVRIDDEYADVARPLSDGVYDITSLLTQKGAEMDAFIEIRCDGKLWHSEPFILVVEDLPAIGSQIEKQYPTALEQALDEAEAYLAQVRAAAKEIKELKAKALTLYPGQPATAEYDVTTGTITIGVPQGIDGAKGEPGKDGRDGEQGPRGEKGETGPQGPKGDAGAQGPKGERGLTGETKRDQREILALLSTCRSRATALFRTAWRRFRLPVIIGWALYDWIPRGLLVPRLMVYWRWCRRPMLKSAPIPIPSALSPQAAWTTPSKPPCATERERRGRMKNDWLHLPGWDAR